MEYRDKRVLVTGAAGFIGSHLTQQLVRLGADVRAMTHYRADPSLHNLEFLSREELEAVEIVRGNIEDNSFVRAAVRGRQIVFHLAALIGIPYSYTAPMSYVATNINGTLNLLEAAKDEGVERIIHTSTSECYGTAQYTPIDEAHPLQGQSPYSATKIGADKIAESYYRSFELPVVTLRPFNTYGPRQSARAVIPTILAQILSGADTLRLGNLDSKRDLTFVIDTARAFLLAGQAAAVEGELIHFGSGQATTIQELAQLALQVCASDATIEVDPDRIRPEKSEVEVLLCDPAKAERMIGWEPEVSLEEGLGRVRDFIAGNLHLYRATAYNI